MTGLLSKRSPLLALALSVLLALFYKPLTTWLKSDAVDNVTSIKTTPLKLYGGSMSTCTRRVATILKEKDVPYELVTVDMSKREHKSPEYLASKQPFGQVPVLQDGDFVLYESRAIARYVALKFADQGTPLLPPPSDLQSWARFEEAASVEQNNFDAFASGIAYEKVFKIRGGGATDEIRVESLTASLEQKLDGYERILSGRRYLAGDNITVADLFHLPYGTMISDLGYKRLFTSRPSVARWWEEISSRPSWQSVKDGA